MNIGEMIKKQMKIKKIKTQAELAKLTGITEAGISQLINGQRKPNFQTLLALNSALDLNIDRITK